MIKEYIKKTWKLLNPSERIKAFFIIIIMIVSVLLETLSVGLIIPVVSIFLADDYLTNFPQISIFLEKFIILDRFNLILLVLSIFLFVYLVKALVLLYFNWTKETFYNLLNSRLSNDLILKYLQQPFIFHLKFNSAELIRNMTSVSSIASTLDCILIIITETFFLLSMLLLLLYADITSTMIIFSLIGFVSIIYFLFFKNTLKSLGSKSLHHSKFYNKYLLESFAGIKLIKNF